MIGILDGEIETNTGCVDDARETNHAPARCTGLAPGASDEAPGEQACIA